MKYNNFSLWPGIIRIGELIFNEKGQIEYISEVDNYPFPENEPTKINCRVYSNVFSDKNCIVEREYIVKNNECKILSEKSIDFFKIRDKGIKLWEHAKLNHNYKQKIKYLN